MSRTLGVAAHRPDAFPPGAEDRLREYTEMIATAVRNAEDRSRLDHHAGVDALTALPNHRAFHERLAEEVSRARRHERPLTVAVVDVDRFRELTESIGPDAADHALVEIGGLLRSVVHAPSPRRAARRVGRPVRPRRRADGRRAAAPRRRRAVLEQGARPRPQLGLRPVGRPRPRGLRPPARPRDRAGAVGLRALARAIDAKDPATREHSERVATLAARLATERGWDPQCVERLREAGALHDVGKIGVPDAALLKPGPLDRAEMALMREHAALGARIVGDVLDEVQVRWIAAHHERPDGEGYPNGLTRAEIPEGAALLALGDAWDSMVSARLYTPPCAIQEALDEIRALAGRQFTVEAVQALEALHERGALAMAAARMHRPTPEPATPHAA